MNSHVPNPSSALMEHAKVYDDSYLRKRITCLTSGLLLCLVIAIAAIGISIIVLLKFQDLEVPENGEMQNKFADLQLQLKNLEGHMRDNHMKKATFKDKESSPSDPKLQEKVPPSEHHSNHGENIHDHDEENSADSSDSNLKHHEHHSIPESPIPSENGLLCDDSDLCLPSEGSGEHIVDLEEELIDMPSEGSGISSDDDDDDCFEFARPACSPQFKICYTFKNKCPVPICCLE